MNLRPYQIEDVEAVIRGWETHRALLGIAATGMGKTVIGCHVAKHRAGRVKWLAHREELIFQAARSIQKVIGDDVDIEMGELRAAESGFGGKSRVVVSSIQTQNAGRRNARMTRFDPFEFSTLIIDEAHHAAAASYKQVIGYYRQNPDLVVLGLTATPNRHDERALLGPIFDAVVFRRDILYGIDNGWLVPVLARPVHVGTLDLSAVRTSAGDLNGADLAEVLEYEKTLLGMAVPTIEIACGVPQGTIQRLLAEAIEIGIDPARYVREHLAIYMHRRAKTLVFAATVRHAERFCEILNRYMPGSACVVSGKTERDKRRRIFSDFATRRFQYLVNVGVTTEGFDDPGIEIVVMGRPTCSETIYTQIFGRATRPLAGVVDRPDLSDSAEMRKAAIQESDKPRAEVIDFVGNTGRHRLISTADVLRGEADDEEVVDRARQRIQRSEEPVDTRRALAEAAAEVKSEREAREREEEERRSRLLASATYTCRVVDPFDAFGIQPWRASEKTSGRPITPAMQRMLRQQGIDSAGMTYAQAGQLVAEIRKRWKDGRCSFRQAKILAERGYSTECTAAEAKQIIDAISAKEKWRPRKKTRRPVAPSTAPLPPTMERF